MVEILEPFEEVTKEFERDDAFLSEVIPLILTLKKLITEELNRVNDPLIETLLNVIDKSLNSRIWEKIILTETYIFSTVLDPRFKFEPILKYVKVDECKKDLLHMMQEQHSFITENSQTNHANPFNPGLKKIKLTVWNKYYEFKNSERDVNTFNYSFYDELEAYLEGAGLASDNHPLTFWRLNDKIYPTLAKLAIKYFCISPGSSVSERVFSTAGNIVTKKRSKLKQEKVNMLVFLYSYFNKKL